MSVQHACSTGYFKPYTNSDVVGCELGGAVKNVIALATGMAEGMGFGDNTKASLITRGLAETARLGAALGADPLTFSGLAGLGDLTLSCTSTQSRNYRYGMSLGRGEHPGHELAEGVLTAPVAKQLADREQVDAPLIDAVNLLLSGGAQITDIVAGLMSRPLKREQA